MDSIAKYCRQLSPALCMLWVITPGTACSWLLDYRYSLASSVHLRSLFSSLNDWVIFRWGIDCPGNFISGEVSKIEPTVVTYTGGFNKNSTNIWITIAYVIRSQYWLCIIYIYTGYIPEVYIYPRGTMQWGGVSVHVIMCVIYKSSGWNQSWF